jgi:RNA polymerase sigma factor (sigma-70 family)
MVAMMTSGASSVCPPTEERLAPVTTFEDVYTEHHLALLRFARLVAGDRHVAEDAVADVFARLLNRRNWLQADDMGRYLRRCVANELRGRWRKERRRAVVWDRFHRGAGASGAETAVEDHTDASNQRQRIEAALVKLPVRQRAVVVLRLYEDRSEAETAEILGVALGTVKATYAQARANLSELLREA